MGSVREQKMGLSGQKLNRFFFGEIVFSLSPNSRVSHKRKFYRFSFAHVNKTLLPMVTRILNSFNSKEV